MWKFMTILNLAGGATTIYALIKTGTRYYVGPRMGFYMFLTIASMVALCFAQVYTWGDPAGKWTLKLAGTYWWVKTLYFSWAIRFSSIKKK